MLKFEYVRVVFQRAKQIGIIKALAFAVILFIVLGQVATKFNLVRAVGLYSAQGILGQLEHSTAPVYTPNFAESTFSSDNNVMTPNTLGFNAPNDTVVDYINHRMFIADNLNNRVLVFNLNEEDQIVNYVPDYVLGQIDFVTSTSGTTANTLSAPSHLAFNDITEELYVSDTDNNRILVFDVEEISNGEPAVNVLGQIDVETSTGLAGINLMNQPLGINFDSETRLLYVADSGNNRVLVFNVGEIVNGEPAVNVLGQPDFETVLAGDDADSFNVPYDVAYSSTTHTLFVTDSGNNRVMAFDLEIFTDGEPALDVLGQPDFETRSAGSGDSGLSLPQGLELDRDFLYVGDSGNSRVMIFDVIASAVDSGEPAVNVLGQVDFDSADFDWPAHSTQIFGSVFNGGGIVAGLFVNTSTNELYAIDPAVHRIMVFNVSDITDGESVSNILGFYSETSEDVFGGFTYTQADVNSGGATPNKYGFESLISVEIDTVNHRLFAITTFNETRILVFDLNSENELVDYEADYVLGQDDFVSIGNQDAISGVSEPYDMAFDPDTSYLYVSNAGSDRISVFDVASITNNEPAIHVLGQADFDINNNSLVVSQSNIENPSGISLDTEDNLLYVADSIHRRVLVFDVSEITDGEPAVNVLGQLDFVSETYATTASTFNTPSAVSVDPVNKKLYVADNQYHRVMVFDVSEITNGEPAVNVLGADTFTDASAGTTASQFTFQAAVYTFPDLFVNPNNQKLFVSDNGNNRVLIFDVSSVTNGEDAVAVIGQDDFDSLATGTTQTSFNAPKGLGFDALTNRVFVADTGNNRVLEFGFVEITTNSLESANAGEFYAQELTSSNSQGTVTYEVYEGNLPEGLAIEGDQITGVPPSTTDSNIYNFSIIAKDEIEGVGIFYSNPVEFSFVITGTGSGGGGGGGSGNENIYPIVEIENPTQSQIFLGPQVVNVLVQAADVDGEISKVELFLDGVLLGEKTESPYSFELSGLGVGNHMIFAQAVDDGEFTSVSSEITFTISPVATAGGGGGDTTNPLVKKACADGRDNDLDGAIDFPNDLGCTSLSDNSEKDVVSQTYACSDGIDNDEDGFTDMGDIGCSSESDNNEFNAVIGPDVEDEIYPDPCEESPEICEQILVEDDRVPKILTDISLCPPGIFNSASCITKESLDYTKEVLGLSIEQAWEIIDSPYGNSLTKTISVVSLVFGAIFTVLPALFINPLSFSEILLIPVRLWSLLMSALGVKKKVRKWGVVYDSVTKRPLDPVYVSLQDAEGKEIASSITDLDGRYGFLVEPGKYRIVPKKTNYSFPSLKMVGKTRDEIYLDLYFGYVFEIVEQGGVIVKNIPMDPITFDWNEFAKDEKKLTNFYSKRDIIVNRIGDFAFSLGFIMAIIAFISAPIVYNIMIFALYVGLMVFREIGFRQKKSGKVIRKGTDIPLAYAIIRVYDFNTNTEVTQKVADKIGMFFCFILKGEYYITIESKEDDGLYKKVFQSEKIKVVDGIIDNTFEV